MQDWARQERDGDLNLIQETREVFSAVADFTSVDIGRAAIVVDTILRPIPSQRHRRAYLFIYGSQRGTDTQCIGTGVDPANGAAPAVPEGGHGISRHGPAHPVDVSLVWQYNRPNAFAWNCLLVDLSGAYPAYDGARDDNRRRQLMFAHIVSDPEILGGKPCVKDTRISVELILELFASGATHQDVLDTYPHLTTEGITEALRYAARFLKNENILVAEVAA